MTKGKTVPREQRKDRLGVSYATATYRTLGRSGREPIERQRYNVGRTESGFVVFDLMNGNTQFAGPFGTRKEADDWMRTNAAP